MSITTRIAALLGIGLVAGACGGDRGQTGAAATEQAAPAAEQAPAAAGTGAQAVAETGPVYLDVRTAEERAAGHVAGSLHIPVDELEARLQELEPYRDRDMVVYCRSGRRSANAINLLQDHGFTRLTNGGGLNDMSARGLPITR